MKSNNWIRRSAIIPFLIIFGILLSSNAQAHFEMGSAVVKSGGQSTINLNFTGDINKYAGVNLKIIFPQGISVTGVSKGDVLNNGAFTLDYKIGADSVSVIAYSATDLFKSNGVFLTFSFTANAQFQAQNNIVDFVASGCALSNAEGSDSIAPTTKEGTITVQAGPSGDVDSYKVLLDSSPPFTVAYGDYVRVFGSTGINTINVESGGIVEFRNCIGANIINIEDESSNFKVYRSGATVYLMSSLDTLISIPATKTSQTLRFKDGSSKLVISINKVMIGGQEITRTQTQLEPPVNTADTSISIF